VRSDEAKCILHTSDYSRTTREVPGESGRVDRRVTRPPSQTGAIGCCADVVIGPLAWVAVRQTRSACVSYSGASAPPN
jgi:hypothetical protein